MTEPPLVDTADNNFEALKLWTKGKGRALECKSVEQKDKCVETDRL